MRNGRAGAQEVTLRLNDPNELFEPRGPDVEAGRAPEPPAIEHIQDELRSHPRTAPPRLAVVLPAVKATPEVERGIKQAVARYCEAGIARAEHDTRALRREGLQTLVFGAVVLATGLLLSEAVMRTRSWPKELRDFFGNGLFLVVAWVGLWYPLDTLIFSGRPYRTELRMLRTLRQIEIVVRAAGEAEHVRSVVPGEPVADQSLTGG